MVRTACATLAVFELASCGAPMTNKSVSQAAPLRPLYFRYRTPPMPTATSVVTPNRYAQGLTYADFLAQAAVNVDKFQQNYKSAPLSVEDLAFFKRAAAQPGGPAKILAIAEAWCGDVYRELPTVARMAEATGMELRVFLRDDNP